jgi:hypothetical protein
MTDAAPARLRIDELLGGRRRNDDGELRRIVLA